MARSRIQSLRCTCLYRASAVITVPHCGDMGRMVPEKFTMGGCACGYERAFCL